MAAEIYRRTGVSKDLAFRMLGALADMAMDGLLDDGEFTVPGVVTMGVYERPPLHYKDLHTGRYRDAPQGYKVKATPSTTLRKGVREAARGHDVRKD